MTDGTDDKQPKHTMRERLEAHGFKVRESSNEGTVISSDTIDIALADTIAGMHWLHPSQKHRGDPKLAAIRAKHRALYFQRHRRAGR
jgi:hypothetical protein